MLTAIVVTVQRTAQSLRIVAGLINCIIIGAFSPTAHAQGSQVDLELVLAMDGSGSINDTEFALQLAGTSAAFRDPSIQNAIQSGPLGRISVAVLIWSDAAFPKFQSKWYVLDGAESANAFGNRILTLYKRTGRKYGIGGGGTGIGDGIRFALEMLKQNKYNGLRRVIDVSGDGVETDPWFKKAVMLPEAKQLAAFQSVTVNGLAILTDFPHLDEWYRSNVITGPGAFVIKADGFEDFEQAIREKLWREISHTISLVPQKSQQKLANAGLPID